MRYYTWISWQLCAYFCNWFCDQWSQIVPFSFIFCHMLGFAFFDSVIWLTVLEVLNYVSSKLQHFFQGKDNRLFICGTWHGLVDLFCFLSCFMLLQLPYDNQGANQSIVDLFSFFFCLKWTCYSISLKCYESSCQHWSWESFLLPWSRTSDWKSKCWNPGYYPKVHKQSKKPEI